MARKLRKVEEEAWIGGVCAGVAYGFEIPVWIVRLVFVLAAFGSGIGLGLYILLWILMPNWEKAPEDYDAVTGG